MHVAALQRRRSQSRVAAFPATRYLSMFETKTAALSADGVVALSASSPLGAEQLTVPDSDDDGYPSREEIKG
jgi:hypothetical protein